jgi:phosphatidylglycerophosphate synthase
MRSDVGSEKLAQRKRAEKKVKTLFGWLIFRRISLPLALMLARTRIRPWQITFLGLAFGLAGASFLANGHQPWLIAGAFAACIAKLLDAVDGEVARAKQLDSANGYVVDGLTDRLRDTALILGLGLGAYRAGSHVAAWWTITAVVGYLGFFYVSAAAPSHWREIRSSRDLDEKHMFRINSRIRLGAGDSFAVGIFTVAAVGHPLWLVVAIALASPLAISFKLRKLFAAQPWLQ